MIASHSYKCYQYRFCYRHHRFIHPASSRRNWRELCIKTSHGRSFLLTLEHSIGGSPAPLETELFNSGSFQYSVHPKLPVATTWKGLLESFGSPSQPVPSGYAQRGDASGVKRVETLPVNVRTSFIKLTRHAQLEAFATETIASMKGSSAILCVSGSHPIRTVPAVTTLFPDSVKLIQTLKRLQASGTVAPAPLWAAGNPVIETNAARLEQKAAAGASAFLTQPPLAWDNFESWMNDAEHRGVSQACRIIIGIPMLTSRNHLRFWLQLCGADVKGQSRALLQEWSTAESQMAKKEFLDFRTNWNRRFIEKVKAVPGVKGAHIMPFSKAGRKMTLDFIEDGTL